MTYARKRLIKDVCSIQTAPYREHHVRKFIKSFCHQRNLHFTEDRYGNLIVCYGNNYCNPLFCFSSHMDHPGFVTEKDSQDGWATALFYGGVESSFFPLSKVRFFSHGREIQGAVKKVERMEKNGTRRVLVKVDGGIKAGDLGMWDLEPFYENNHLLYSRACDDLIGCSAILCLLDECVKRKIPRQFLGVFTSAEESGLHGAKQLCLARMLPESCFPISVETSSQLPGVSPGDGVVVRVGDKVSVFDDNVTRFMNTIATELSKRDASFSFRRKLMDGGRCEASVYQKHGYTTGGLCVPLANYHNRNRDSMKIDLEYVDANDVNSMIELCLAIIDNSTQLSSSPAIPRYRESQGKLGEFFLWE